MYKIKRYKTEIPGRLFRQSLLQRRRDTLEGTSIAFQAAQINYVETSSGLRWGMVIYIVLTDAGVNVCKI